METIAQSKVRTQIRVSIHYLRTIRPLVERIATEHAAWARFIATAISPSGSMSHLEQAVGAARFAMTFASLRERLQRATPTASCARLHESALAWVEALDLLATAVLPAIEARSSGELRAIGREATEAQIRVRIFQRTHAATVASLKQLFAARPRPARPARPVRPLRRGAPLTAARIGAAATTLVGLPPWRRPRPTLIRRASGF